MSTLYFDLAQAIDVIGETKTDPCGDIRRINVEIPSLSVSDMKRLKATDRVSIYLSVSDMNRPSVSDGPICHGLYQSVCLVPNTNLILIQTHKPEAMQLDIRVCPFLLVLPDSAVPMQYLTYWDGCCSPTACSLSQSS